MNAPVTQPPQARTLLDRLRMLRRHGLMIAIIAVVAAGVAVVLSARQENEYTATATIDFLDPTRQVGVIGGQASNTSAATFAAQGVSRLTSDKTLGEVRTTLRTPLTIDQLRDKIEAVSDPATYTVTVTVKAPTAQFAADLANAVTGQAKADADAAAARQFAKVAAQFDAQIKGLTPTQKANPLTVTALIDQRSRARALARGGATAATIQSPARVPSSPSSPKPLINGIIGLILGLLLGLAVAAVRESFDRRLRSSTEIENELDLPIIGHIREESLGKVAQATGGAATISPADLEAFRILRTNVEFLDVGRELKTVIVTSALPQEGKSTVASSLAFASAAAGRRTLLVECDLRRPTLSKRLGLHPRPGLTDFLMGQSEPGEILQQIAIGVQDPNHPASMNGSGSALGQLVVITAGTPSMTPAELLASNRFTEFLKGVSAAYDLVVIDTSPVLPVADTLELVPNVDAILFCVRASRTTRDQALAAKAAIERFPARPSGLVVTGARDPYEYGAGYYAPYTYDYRATTSAKS